MKEYVQCSTPYFFHLVFSHLLSLTQVLGFKPMSYKSFVLIFNLRNHDYKKKLLWGWEWINDYGVKFYIFLRLFFPSSDLVTLFHNMSSYSCYCLSSPASLVQNFQFC